MTKRLIFHWFFFKHFWFWQTRKTLENTGDHDDGSDQMDLDKRALESEMSIFHWFYMHFLPRENGGTTDETPAKHPTGPPVEAFSFGFIGITDS